ncbi:MAG: lipopolysaccharide kinase InaA family protein [Thermodesulfobacteriota bacterium]
MRSDDYIEYQSKDYKGFIRKGYHSKPFMEFLDNIDSNIKDIVIDHYAKFPKDVPAPTDRMVTVLDVPSLDGTNRVFLKEDDFERAPNFAKSFKSIFKKSRGMKGWLAATRLLEGFVLVPEPIAYIEKRGLLRFKRGYFFMEYVEGSLNLGDKLKDGEDHVRLIVQAGDLLRSLHELDCSHGDMKASNFLVGDEGDRYRLYMIDTEDMKFHKKIKKMHRMKDLLRFVRSIPDVEDQDMDMLLSGYGKNIRAIGDNITPRELRQFFYSNKPL